MKTVKSGDHLHHQPVGEIYHGQLVEPFERASRHDHVVAALEAAGLIDTVAPESVGSTLLSQVHDSGYLDFLEQAWADWTAAGAYGDMIPTCFPVRRMPSGPPTDIDGRLGWYAFAAETAITGGTWTAARAAASIAHTAQRLVSGGEPMAFALCRPPGHHASRDYFGGYCFLNNAAVAAQGFRNDGAERVAILDVDFHHGNGTQDIFYERSDVFFASLHGDPRHEFPYFTGFATETGNGAGAGANANYPLAPGTSFAEWSDALDNALAKITTFGVDALVVSLGVDTFENDPISSFKLSSDDFATYGRRIGELAKPTVYCMEGGYAIDEIGTNTVNVLTGHLSAS